MRPREIVLLGQSADIGLSWALFTDSGDRLGTGGRVLVRAGEEGLGLGLRLLVPAVEMTRLDLAVGEDGTWRIAFTTLSKMEHNDGGFGRERAPIDRET